MDDLVTLGPEELLYCRKVGCGRLMARMQSKLGLCSSDMPSRAGKEAVQSKSDAPPGASRRQRRLDVWARSISMR